MRGSLAISDLLRLFLRRGFRAVAHVVHEDTHEPSHNGYVANPFQWVLPEFYSPRDVRVFGQAAVKFGIGRVVQHVNHAGAANPGWIVHTCVSKAIESLGLGVIIAK